MSWLNFSGAPIIIKTFRSDTNKSLSPTSKAYTMRNSRTGKIENLPEGLEKFRCVKNGIKKIENLPKSLNTFLCGSSTVLYKFIIYI